MSTRLPYNHPDFRIDFIGIGAAKSGTTWIADRLREHPSIFIPEKKELVYFNENLRLLPGTKNPDHTQSLSWYHAHFNEGKSSQLKGEISVEYLLDVTAASAIYAYNPNVKILLSLREHAEQLHSLYLYMSSRGVFHYSSFEEAIEKRSDLFLNYSYSDHLRKFDCLFPEQAIKVLFFDDLRNDAQAWYDEICSFLKIEQRKLITPQKKSNATKKARLPIVNRVVQKGRHLITEYGLEFLLPLLRVTGILRFGRFVRDKLNVTQVVEKKLLKQDTRSFLRKHYASDVEELERRFDRSLNHWK